MAVSLRELQQELDRLLQPGQFRDYCPNGLQVEGRGQVQRLATGVTASQALVDAAIEWEADAILVHHGYFWKGEEPVLVGMKRRRLAALLGSDTSLLAYHLPLDAHPELGNNACLGRLLGIEESEPLQPGNSDSVGNLATLDDPATVGDFLARLREVTGREPLHIGDPEREVLRVAWCTGAAQGYIDAALAARADLYITGEVSEQTVHTAREEGIDFIAAGHHATERYGVQAVGESMAERFDLEHRFIDIDNPV
ncbi:Nif3-like dinuclear metal center hexameric protein [Parahaliea maris]|uniref:GTP cyclohydrolase 1 type 2 homolog n=1 Tax=Parahaliea maris TaxID=2716870 RepID=A0A5C9A9M6_9GAMM|nr:Nif3-like dinuclear metal center hexameric protein [Parahaliea maris]TXS96350.1 Nif3-like dinuclear metal center hexameric protein [Parahaliea maris]